MQVAQPPQGLAFQCKGRGVQTSVVRPAQVTHLSSRHQLASSGQRLRRAAKLPRTAKPSAMCVQSLFGLGEKKQSLPSEEQYNKLAGKEELATELRKKVLPETNKAGVKLYLVTIGPAPRGKEFCKLTGFPEDRLLADPENSTYSAMGFKQGFFSTFLNPKTPISIFQRVFKDGAEGLKEVLPKAKLWIPGKAYKQGTQQGGALAFNGKSCFWEHYDEATAAHADPMEVKQVALSK